MIDDQESLLSRLRAECPKVEVRFNRQNGWGVSLSGYAKGERVLFIRSGSVKGGAIKFRDAYSQAVARGIIK